MVRESRNNNRFYVPLESMPERYTEMMNEVCRDDSITFLYPPELLGVKYEISSGTVLDANHTTAFKAKQLEMIAELFSSGKVKSGDCFMFADIWFFGLEALRYMAESQGVDVKIGAINHAGRADKHDFTRSFDDWADSTEIAYHKLCDLVFTGSQHQRLNVLQYFPVSADRVVALGMPFSRKYVRKHLDEEVNFTSKIEHDSYVIWPHRFVKEKGSNELIQLAEMLPELHFYVTSCGSIKGDLVDLPNLHYKDFLTKREYYKLLYNAEVFLSTSYQETFGYSLHEAICLDTPVLVPDRASYKEYVCQSNRYSTLSECARLLNRPMKHPEIIPEQRWRQYEGISNLYFEALECK